jgi:hypothetical protein
MKKGFLLVAIGLTLGLTTSTAQEIKVGIYGGIPVGDSTGNSDFTLGADVAYLFYPTDMIQVGPMLGYSHYFVTDADAKSFLPIAASGRFSLGDAVFAGVDLGYAVGMNSNNSGFYYRPKLGYDLLGLWIVGSYEGISRDEGTVSSVNAGVEFTF